MKLSCSLALSLVILHGCIPLPLPVGGRLQAAAPPRSRITELRTSFSPQASPTPDPTADLGNHRLDPLNGLKKYRGGYDIESKHYWVSAAFTGIYGYAIGMAIFLLGLVLFALLIAYQVRKRKEDDASSYSVLTSFHIVLVVAVVFVTLVALVFCALILASNKKLHSEARSVERILVAAADHAAGTIYNITSVISRVSTTLKNNNEMMTTTESLFSTGSRLYLEGREIHKQVKENRHLLDETLDAVYVAVVVASSATMLLLIAGLSMMDLRTSAEVQWRSQLWWWLFSFVVLLFWIFTIFSWFAFGLSLTTYNVVGDTCQALQQYERDPYSNTLASILPCVDLKAANKSVLKMRAGLYSVIVQANQNISMLRHKLDTSSSEEEEMDIPHICNPFSGPPHYKLTGKCLRGTVSIGRVPEVLKPFQCSQDDVQACVTVEGKRIPSSVFKLILDYSSAAETLIEATPAMESLTNCSFVVDAFSAVVTHRCRPLLRSLHLLWASYAGLATAASLLLALYARHLLLPPPYLRVTQ